MKVTKKRPTNLGEGASPSTARPVGSGPPPGGGGGGQTGIKMTKKRAGRNRTPPPPPPPPLSSFAIRIAQAIRDSKFGEEWDSTPCQGVHAMNCLLENARRNPDGSLSLEPRSLRYNAINRADCHLQTPYHERDEKRSQSPSPCVVCVQEWSASGTRDFFRTHEHTYRSHPLVCFALPCVHCYYRFTITAT